MFSVHEQNFLCIENGCKIKDALLSKSVKEFRVLHKLESASAPIIHRCSLNHQLTGNTARPQGILHH
jgi:hypothetical protein